MNREILDRAIKKAQKSECRFKIAAIAFSDTGEFLGVKNNQPRLYKKGGGIHAEMAAMQRWNNVKTIVLLRCNVSGGLLPISPCEACQNKANDLSVKIVTIGK